MTTGTLVLLVVIVAFLAFGTVLLASLLPLLHAISVGLPR